MAAARTLPTLAATQHGHAILHYLSLIECSARTARERICVCNLHAPMATQPQLVLSGQQEDPRIVHAKIATDSQNIANGELNNLLGFAQALAATLGDTAAAQQMDDRKARLGLAGTDNGTAGPGGPNGTHRN